MKGIEKARKAIGHMSCPQDREDEMYRLGMLAAADIAERMYFTHTPDDGVISGEGVADEIRKRANDI